MRPSEGPLRLLRWVLCQLLPVWLCLSASGASVAAAAVEDASMCEPYGASVVVLMEVLEVQGTPEQPPCEVGAPMCDPHAASVDAPAEVPEVDRGKLTELPCDALLLWLGSGIDLSGGGDSAKARDGAPRPVPELQLQRGRHEGVMTPVVVLPARSDERLLPPSDFTGLPARPGHRTAVFRPPMRAAS